jgi:hypothetical protein
MQLLETPRINRSLRLPNFQPWEYSIHVDPSFVYLCYLHERLFIRVFVFHSWMALPSCIRATFVDGSSFVDGS